MEKDTIPGEQALGYGVHSVYKGIQWKDGFDLGLEGSIEIYCLEEDRLLC